MATLLFQQKGDMNGLYLHISHGALSLFNQMSWTVINHPLLTLTVYNLLRTTLCSFNLPRVW